MTPVRLGAVSYLNARPLVWGLEARPDLFAIRGEVPSRCAALLHEGQIDVGLIPAIEYLRGDYRIVPDIAIASRGAVLSVAIFSRTRIDDVQTLALDVSSRTSVALARILCARRWGIAPRLMPAEPDLRAMLATADAALLIGDAALYADAASAGAEKHDLGAEWLAMTGLPFVYAVWAGREGAADAEHLAALGTARDGGVANLATIASEEAAGDPSRLALARRYLHDNLGYHLGAEEIAGLRRFFEVAADLDLVPGLRPLRYFGAGERDRAHGPQAD